MNSVSTTYRQSSILPPRGLLIAILAQLPLVASGWPLRPAAMEIVAGAVLVVAGVTLNLWSASLFERDEVGICPFSAVGALVTDGPFGLSRNPMYVGMVAIALGLDVATGVLANVWVSVAFAIWLHHAYVLPEERFLRERFGAGYVEYSGRVPRWLLIRSRAS